MVLGFDTSAYTTSLALVHQGRLVKEIRRMLPVEKGERGLRQQTAYYLHHQHLTQMLPELMATAGLLSLRDLVGVGASTTPAHQAGSFMPVFTAGEQIARTVAHSLGIPFVAYDHQRGHLRAALYGHEKWPEVPFTAFHLSGGTTEILFVEEDLKGKVMGGSLDLSFGQVVDRVGVALGLPFPSGAHLELLSKSAESKDRYKVAFKGQYVNLSGVENQAARDMQEGVCPEVIARRVENTLIHVLTTLMDDLEGPMLLTGGVMRNAHIRQACQDRYGDRLFLGDPRFSSDNALGVALATEESVIR